MAFAANQLQALLNVSAITGLLDTFFIGETEYPMLVHGMVMDDAWGPQKSTINYYQAESISGGIDYGDYVYYINCRAAKESDSRTIAHTVFNQINRLTRGQYNAVCALLKPIPPADETDNFNSIVEIKLRTKGTVN